MLRKRGSAQYKGRLVTSLEFGEITYSIPYTNINYYLVRNTMVMNQSINKK